MIFKDYYKILGLDTNKNTIEEIKAAYRVQAKKYHPDVNVGNNMATERFKDINEAYRVLSNNQAKRKYDRMWNARIGKKIKKASETRRSKDAVFSDFFNMFFGNIEETETESRKPEKGENVETQINVSIQEAFFGAEKKIVLKDLEGNDKTYNITIPKGITNGEKIRLIGQGKNGKNGGKNGDLYIQINIQNNKVYKLIEKDIYTDLLLTPWEASLGTKAEVNLIDQMVSIVVPEGTESGEKIVLDGKGYQASNGERGNLIAEVKIVVPKNLSNEERDLYKKLKQISKFEPRKTTIL